MYTNLSRPFHFSPLRGRLLRLVVRSQELALWI